MSRATRRGALLDHPAFPVEGCGPPGREVVGRRWTLRERRLVAAQLLAAAAAALDVDLWIGAGAVRSARVVGKGDEVRVILGRSPLPLGPVLARLGGGERAFHRACDRLEGVVRQICGVDDAPPQTTGWGLDSPLEDALDVLGAPLPLATARYLWGSELPLLPEPAPGEQHVWHVPAAEAARRLAGELVARLRSRGRAAWLVSTGFGEDATAPRPASGTPGVLVVAGSLADEDVSAAERWGTGDGRSVVMVGSLPAGWRPPFPNGGACRLLLVGLHGEQRHRLLSGELSRFSPFDAGHRSVVTTLASRLFGKGRDDLSAAAEPLERWLALSRDGLPEGFLLSCAGRDRRSLEALETRGRIVRVDGLWRLAAPAELRSDPDHLRVAQVYSAEDPRRFLHEMLGGGEAAPLEAWLEDRLRDCDSRTARNILWDVEPRDLTVGLRRRLAEACLMELDPVGARRALRGLEDDSSIRWVARWLDAVDRGAGWEPPELDGSVSAATALPFAGVALAALTVAVRAGRGSSDDAQRGLRQAIERLHGPVARWFELHATWLLHPERLRDREWRGRVVGRHGKLRLRWLHLRGLDESRRGRLRASSRAVRTLLSLGSGRLGPGWAGQVALDAAQVALERGQTEISSLLHLKALRLLESAGFERRIDAVRFNLAVLDLDRLRLPQAEKRFRELCEDGSDSFAEAELARLELARGDLRRMRERLEDIPPAEAESERLAAGVRFLRGAGAALEGQRAVARSHLREGGEEGASWLTLLDAVDGKTAGPASAGGDGWGVAFAADIVRQARRSRAESHVPWPEVETMRPREAMAVALACRLTGSELDPPSSVRLMAKRILRRQGMFGWAESLESSADESEIMEALAELGERGTTAFDSPELLRALLERLSVTGLEVRVVPGGCLVDSIGSGDPGEELAGTRAAIVPLGGDTSDDPLWRVMLSLLEPHAPVARSADGSDESRTGILGTSEAMVALREEIGDLAPARLPVIVLGETGVGKELVARALHRMSGRRGRFVPVNMAGLPDHLLESELFGAVRGAYTGADRSRDGLVQAADGGTLFLDEIGELDPRLQAKLLRFLETGEVRPVGADLARPVDVRVVSATNRDAVQLTREGVFRLDLFYRLATAAIKVPPLREHLSDLPELQARFEHEAIRSGGVSPASWSRAAREAMRSYHWPGNVRELRHVVAVALARARGRTVQPEHLAFEVSETAPARRWNQALEETKRSLIVDALARHDGNRSAAARELGISRQTLLYHMRILKIR